MGITVEYETENYYILEVNKMYMIESKDSKFTSGLFETVDEAIESLPERN